MAIVRSVVTFQGVSGLPEDRYQNTWHFDTSVPPVAATYGYIAEALDMFYCGDAGPQSAPLMTRFARDRIIANPKPSVTHYTIEVGGGAGSPEAVSDLLSWTSAVSDDLPNEVALCLSFHSDLDDVPEESGLMRPRSRRRGRVYLGPLAKSACDANGRPDTTFRDDVIYAANELRQHAGLVSHGITWCVYSRQDDQARDVVGGFCDDAFDTQRRRGLATSARSTFP